jgi:adenylate cyclase
MPGPAGSEIERKFLVPKAPDGLAAARATRIDQGYVAIDGGVEVRVRRRDSETVLTIKAGGGRDRAEEELAVDGERFARLWPLTEGRRIEKTRYELGQDPLIEVDVYAGSLDGLIVAEVEFASDEAAEAFVAPAWFGREVTEDARFKNQRLATEGAPPDDVIA